MRIPSTFPILGQLITVKVVPLEEWKHGAECVGMWTPAANLIELRGDYTGSKREQVFFHELIHALLDSISHRLSENEVFVDQLASVLHQALSGARYTSKRKVIA
jgi:hypothetical protein